MASNRDIFAGIWEWREFYVHATSPNVYNPTFQQEFHCILQHYWLIDNFRSAEQCGGGAAGTLHLHPHTWKQSPADA